jgi:hypothetical protein
MGEMTNKDQAAAGAALMEWFASQGISPFEAAKIMHFALYAILMELADECKARSN